MAAPPQPASPAQALDNLQAMINLVLVQSGHFLREQQAGGGSGRCQYQMRKTVPMALDRFQGSLDELEGGIHHAQAVLRRDLALLQADRLKREQAEAAERQRLAAASSKKPEAADLHPKTSTSPSAPMQRESSTSGVETAQPPADAPVSAHTEQKNPDESTAAAPAADPLFDDTSAPNALNGDMDFDAMFDDIGGDETGANDTDNKGDVKTDNAPTQDLSFLDDAGPSGLLRGLEDFAKSGEDASAQETGTDIDIDFAMTDLPDLPANEPSNPPPKTEEDSKPAQPAQNASNDVVMETMPSDAFDDMFIDYPDPETTEFDDAFFGFGEG